jgi:GT2 family glycosyltransferase
MKLSIVIVSWNTRDLLANCLESLALAMDTQTEVLVVDNASQDGTAQLLRERFPWARLIENRENTGFARANNQAIRESSGRYILLLNPDMTVHSGALETLVKFMDAHSAVGVAGSRLLNPDGSLQTSCYPAPTVARELWRLFHLDTLRPYGVYRMADWPLDIPRPVDVLLGACLMLRRELLEQVGLLDESYFMYTEEVDWCYRIRQKGWTIYWVPQAEMVHYGGQSTRQVAAEMFLHLYQSKLRYFYKHHGWTAAQFYKLVLFASAAGRLALTPLAWLERPPQRQQHLTLAGHYWRLVQSLPGL